MYEHKSQQLASVSTFRKRVGKNILIAFCVLLLSLFIGILGYKWTVPAFDWYDSLLNASMILSGMGPMIDADIQLSPAAKVFASFYALFSGITFLSTFGLLMAPVLHRFFHKMHIESDTKD
jgi:hypothetical protein